MAMRTPINVNGHTGKETGNQVVLDTPSIGIVRLSLRTEKGEGRTMEMTIQEAEALRTNLTNHINHAKGIQA